MMKEINNILIRKANDRGSADYGWLKTRYTFSFANYIDPQFMEFRSLRVMNEDRVEPNHGFGLHHHKDMEIITYVIEGELEHQDNMGNGSIIKAGDFQKITAGKGILHSEKNPSSEKPVYLYQIWIVPEVNGLKPAYQQVSVADYKSHNHLQLIGAPVQEEGLIKIHQDVRLYKGDLSATEHIDYEIQSGRGLWVQVIQGQIKVNSEFILNEGDGASIEELPLISLMAEADSEFILFDLK